MRPKDRGFTLLWPLAGGDAKAPILRSQWQKAIMAALCEAPSDAEAGDQDEVAGAWGEASPIVLTERCNLKCLIRRRDESEQRLGGLGQLLDLDNPSHLDVAIKAAQIIDITGFGESFPHPGSNSTDFRGRRAPRMGFMKDAEAAHWSPTDPGRRA